MDIQILPLVGENEWQYVTMSGDRIDWRITTDPVEVGKPWYTLHDDPVTPGATLPRFTSQEAALRHLESEVNFHVDLVLESPAIKAVRDGAFVSLPKLYSMHRMLGEAHCHILEGPRGKGSLLGDRLDPRNDLWDHSPTGIEWGYMGSGPAQLALGILADALGSDRLAVRLHQRFKFEWVSPWSQTQEWMISQLQVACWALEQQTEVWPNTQMAEAPA